MRFIAFALEQPVRDLVAYRRQARGREMARKLARGNIGARNLLSALDDVRVGDFLIAHPDLDLGSILGRKRLKLLKKIAPKNSRMGHRRLVDPLAMEPGKSAQALRAGQLFVAVNEPEERIMKLGARFGRRRSARAEIGVKRLRQRRSGFRVQLFEPINGGDR